MSGDLRGSGKLIADLALDDFTERGVLRRKLFQRFDQWAIATLELLHPSRYYIYQYIRVIDHLERCSDIFVSHGGGQPLFRIRSRGSAWPARPEGGLS